MFYYINIFFIFSLLGHIIENIVYTKVDSGILYGIWTPIYGFGTLSIIFIDMYLEKKKINKSLKPILLFIICALVLGTIETIGGYYIELLYGRIFWNYKYHLMPIGRYTSIQMVSLWGIASVGLIYLLMPYVKNLIKKIPMFLTFILMFLFVIDITYTFLKISSLVHI